MVSIVTKKCVRSSVNVRGGRAANLDFCGECSCRRRGRTRTGSAWGCGRASPLAAMIAPEPLCGCAGSMPHYHSRQGPAGEALLPDSLHCCWSLGPVRHAWPWRRRFSSVLRAWGTLLCCWYAQECWGSGGKTGDARRQHSSGYMGILRQAWGSGCRCRNAGYKMQAAYGRAAKRFEARLEQADWTVRAPPEP